MMESKNFISNIALKLRNDNGDLLSFNGESITFPSSIKKINLVT